MYLLSLCVCVCVCMGARGCVPWCECRGQKTTLGVVLSLHFLWDKVSAYSRPAGPWSSGVSPVFSFHLVTGALECKKKEKKKKKPFISLHLTLCTFWESKHGSSHLHNKHFSLWTFPHSSSDQFLSLYDCDWVGRWLQRAKRKPLGLVDIFIALIAVMISMGAYEYHQRNTHWQ